MMAEGTLSNSLPDLKELESKIGRKTPQSLLVWMKDAALREERWKSDFVPSGDHSSITSDGLFDKIRNLKQEMRCVRSADVRILRQLVAVHEGIEAMRWLMEEHGAVASRDSSLTGSLSSLGALDEEPESSTPPYRKSPSPTSQEDEAGEPLGDVVPIGADSTLICRDYFDRPNSHSTEASSPGLLRSTPGPSCTVEERNGQTWSSPANTSLAIRASTPTPQESPLYDSVPLAEPETRAKSRIQIADQVRQALVRSSRIARRGTSGVRRPTNTLKGAEEAVAHSSPLRENPGAQALEDVGKESEWNSDSRGELLLGYDAQWRWVESEDDVTFV